MLWVWIPLMVRCTYYVINCVSDLRQVDGFLQVFWFPPPVKLPAMIYCNWNIVETVLEMNWSEQSFTGFGQLLIVRTVESDIKHHNPSAIFQLYHGENKLIFNEMMTSSVFSSLCHHLASFVCCPLTFYILIFSSETPRPNELKLGRKHL
jgi:hypothetical protein